MQREWNIPGTLSDVMSMMTYREYKLRRKWIEKQDVEPSKTDWYLMQLAALLEWEASGSKKPRALDRFKLKWTQAKTQQELAENSQRVWLSALGVKDDGN